MHRLIIVLLSFICLFGNDNEALLGIWVSTENTEVISFKNDIFYKIDELDSITKESYIEKRISSDNYRGVIAGEIKINRNDKIVKFRYMIINKKGIYYLTLTDTIGKQSRTYEKSK